MDAAPDIDLDWMHVAIGVQRWRCVKPERPRSWEFEIPFRFVPLYGGPPVNHAISVQHDEQASHTLQERRSYAAMCMHQGREFLHAVVLRASSQGVINKQEFRRLVPITMRLVPRKTVEPDFFEQYDLIRVADDRPEEAILKDKTTGNQVLFNMLAFGKGPDGMLEAAEDAKFRLELMNESSRRNRRVL